MRNSIAIKGGSPSKERIWYWDSVKFFMMLFVVVGHFIEEMIVLGRMDLQVIKAFLYAFHMPLFIFIFGVFYKEKNSEKRAIFFLISGLIMKLLVHYSSLLMFEDVTFSLFYNAGITWFLFVLVWYIVLAKALKKLDKRLVLVISFAISLFTGYFKEIDDFLCLSRMFVFFPYFWLGTMIDRDTFPAKIRSVRKYLLIPAICLLAAWLAICLFGGERVESLIPLFTGRNSFFRETDGRGCLYRLLTTAITVITGLSVLIIVPEKKVPVISYLGRNTINVYFWHYPFLYLIVYLMNVKDHVENNAYLIALILIGIALTFLLSLDIFNFPLKNLNKLIMNHKKTAD